VFLLFQKVVFSQYRNTFCDSRYGIRDTGYWQGIGKDEKNGKKQ